MADKLQDIMQTSQKMYHLSGTMRFNNQFLLRQENVAEHSYMVVSIVNLICEEFNIKMHDHLQALQYAIVHDIPESITGDIISPTKNGIDGLAKSLDQYELNIMIKHFPLLHPAFRSFVDERNIIAFTILKMADYMSVNTCMNREKLLGNKYPFVDEIIEATNNKINTHYEILLHNLKSY